MTEGSQKQRLAAILAADAAGYSRLMEADEQSTVTALDAARNVFRAAIEANHGHVINTAGDSVLALFDTAAGAVTAALAVQRDLEANPSGAPPDRQLRFRIGVHLGDVMETADGDVYGDGVNIAARLQALATPGGIVVSEAVRGSVKSRIAAAFDDLGMQAVKNIDEPVRAFSVRAVGSPVPAARRSGRWVTRRLTWLAAIGALVVIGIGTAWWLRPSSQPRETSAATSSAPGKAAPASKPSIAVLPFDNMSGEADKAYFADGITEDLITDLSKVAGLVVIARNSTFQYKGKAHDVREIGKALNVRYVLEGSVRRSGESVRVNAQLIDAATGAHVWADRYDGEMKDIFGVQDTVTRNVVKALSVELTKDDSDRVAQRGTQNVQALRHLPQGLGALSQADARGFPRRDRRVQEGGGTRSELRARLRRSRGGLLGERLRASGGMPLGLGAPQRRRALPGRTVSRQGNARADAARASGGQRDGCCSRSRHEEAIAEARRAIASDANDANGYIALAGALSFDGRAGRGARGSGSRHAAQSALSVELSVSARAGAIRRQSS